MKKEVYELLKREIINEIVLPSDWALAEGEDWLRSTEPVSEYDTITLALFGSKRKKLKMDLERLHKAKKRGLFKILNWFRIDEDKENGLYVLLNYSSSRLLSYFNVETGKIKYIYDNDEEYQFIMNNLVIYPEDFIGISEKEKNYRIVNRFKKEAINIRYEYYNEAFRSDLDDAKYKILHKYRENKEEKDR